MSAAAGSSGDGGIYLERGPLVYSLNPKEEWMAIEMPEFEITAPDYFPMWAATAGTRWNYGLTLDRDRDIDQQVRFSTNAVGDDPWSNPPVHLEVPARPIENWDLVRPQGHDPEWFQTPPLPSDRSQLGPEETIELVPLGSTQLRLTVFPVIRAAAAKVVDQG